MLNCKIGDLAVIVKTSYPAEVRYIGKIVRCVEPIFSCGWIVEPDIAGYFGVHDDNLRPIRDSDGEDEMLRLAGKPVDFLVGA